MILDFGRSRSDGEKSEQRPGCKGLSDQRTSRPNYDGFSPQQSNWERKDPRACTHGHKRPSDIRGVHEPIPEVYGEQWSNASPTHSQPIFSIWRYRKPTQCRSWISEIHRFSYVRASEASRRRPMAILGCKGQVQPQLYDKVLEARGNADIWPWWLRRTMFYLVLASWV